MAYISCARSTSSTNRPWIDFDTFIINLYIYLIVHFSLARIDSAIDTSLLVMVYAVVYAVVYVCCTTLVLSP